MKKTHIILALVIMVLSSCGSGNGNASKSDSAGTTSTHADSASLIAKRVTQSIDVCALTNNEDILNFGTITTGTNYMYPLSKVNDGVTAFNTYFKYIISENPINTAPLVNDPDQINLSAICDRLNEIKTMMKGTDKKYFSALRMHYGIKEKKMVIIYEPIALSTYEQSYATYGYYRCDDITTSNHFYTSKSDGTLEQIDATNDMKPMVDDYTHNIYIQHLFRGTRDNVHFIDNDADARLGDIHYCIMPIQQILKQYGDNIPDCKAGNPDDRISFNIIADNTYFYKTIHFGRRKNYKLHVVTSFGTLRDDTFDATFNGLAADFGQMCPPNCGWSQIPQFSSRTTQ